MQWAIIPKGRKSVEVIMRGRWTATLTVPNQEWRTPYGMAQVAAWAMALARIPDSGIPFELAANFAAFCLRRCDEGENTIPTGP